MRIEEVLELDRCCYRFFKTKSWSNKPFNLIPFQIFYQGGKDE
jgi:hypothetical protein